MFHVGACRLIPSFCKTLPVFPLPKMLAYIEFRKDGYLRSPHLKLFDQSFPLIVRQSVIMNQEHYDFDTERSCEIIGSTEDL